MFTANVDLHARVLVERVEHLARLAGAAQLDDDAHAVAVGLVAQVADAVDSCAHQLGDARRRAPPCSPGTAAP